MTVPPGMSHAQAQELLLRKVQTAHVDMKRIKENAGKLVAQLLHEGSSGIELPGVATFSQRKTGCGVGDGPETEEVKRKIGMRVIRTFERQAAALGVSVDGYETEYHDQIGDDWMCTLVATVSGPDVAIDRLQNQQQYE